VEAALPLTHPKLRGPLSLVDPASQSQGLHAREREPSASPHADIDALYRRYAPYVSAVATRLLGRDSDVDDLVQDVFLDALRGLSQLRDPTAVKGWLARITVRMAVRRLRRRRLLHALVRESAQQDYEQLAAPSATPEQRALLARVYSTLDGWPANMRVIWLLRHVLDEPLQSIVDWTGCSQSTVQRKLRDAEARLAQELEHA
jgi:RNA polymerase sigma-70 factor (ECF subfamily)